MRKPIIGIIPFFTQSSKEIPYPGNYVTFDYIEKLEASGADVIVLAISDKAGNISEDVLSIVDGFLIHGGNYIGPYHLKTLEYADTNNVPFLGICLGMQVMGLYSSGIEDLKIADLRREIMIDHDPITTDLTRKNPVHSVKLTEGSIIHDLFGDKVNVNSRHSYYTPEVKSPFIVTGRSEDNIIEVIEHEDKEKFLVGVQWHPETMGTMEPLFNQFIKEVRDRV